MITFMSYFDKKLFKTIRARCFDLKKTFTRYGFFHKIEINKKPVQIHRLLMALKTSKIN